jgi:hypothetical protein
MGARVETDHKFRFITIYRQFGQVSLVLFEPSQEHMKMAGPRQPALNSRVDDVGVQPFRHFSLEQFVRKYFEWNYIFEDDGWSKPFVC